MSCEWQFSVAACELSSAILQLSCSVIPQSSLLLPISCIQPFLETFFTFKASRAVSKLTAPYRRDGKLGDTFLLLATHPALVQCEVLKTAGKAESLILTDTQAGEECCHSVGSDLLVLCVVK